ncbi:hypothetical protein BH09MYX1_BH09MYX1_13220 [soil metagenome]
MTPRGEAPGILVNKLDLVTNGPAAQRAAWLPRLLIVTASLVLQRAPQSEPMSLSEKHVTRSLAAGFARVAHTRARSIMVTAAIFAIPLYVCAATDKYHPMLVLPAIAAAVLVAGAFAWQGLSDRFALVAFSAKQDAIARERRDAAQNAPHYLDTASPRAGYRVVDGADQAVSSGGWALLGVRALAVFGLTFGLDFARAALSVYVADRGSIASGLLGAEGALHSPCTIATSVLGFVASFNVALLTTAAWTWHFARVRSSKVAS